MSKDATGDSEVIAIQTIVTALTPLDAEARGRVIEYVFNRLGLRAAVSVGPRSERSQGSSPSPLESAEQIRDIRTLKEIKQPQSAIEMAALVAYYLAELAPPEDRRETIEADDLKRYFKQAQFPLPSKIHMTLVHTKNAGYLDSTGQGTYRLNPVGYNLVVHTLGAGRGDSAPPPRRQTQKRGSKKR